MNRKEITKFLSNLLVQSRLSSRGNYYAREVSLDYGTTNVRRVDFMQFEPAGAVSVSDIEKGVFTSYEVKSCKADFNSGFGRNFVTEKNYFVMPMSLYKEVVNDIPYHVGVICPIPILRDKYEEFDNPTPYDAEVGEWGTVIVKSAHPVGRKRSMIELLFCMLRSGSV